MSVTQIDLGDPTQRGAYDGEHHPPYVVVDELQDGHQLVRSMNGALFSRRLIHRSDGSTTGDSHGRREITRHMGETDGQLIERWVAGVRSGEFQ